MKILFDYLYTSTINRTEKIKNISKCDCTNKTDYLTSPSNSVFRVNKVNHITDDNCYKHEIKIKKPSISIIDKIFEGGKKTTSSSCLSNNMSVVCSIITCGDDCYIYSVGKPKLSNITHKFNNHFYNLGLILFPLTFSEITESSIYVYNIYKYLYCKSFNSYKSCFISLFYYYFGLLMSLICSYRGHSIRILNSNIIVVICKLSSFVRVVSGFFSNYPIGGVLNIKLMNIINNSLCLCNEQICLYKPHLIGLTKYSLTDNGVFSKLSFQETLKFFKNIIFEHNIDWAVDSKANIISSNFIPVGSGWYRYFFNK